MTNAFQIIDAIDELVSKSASEVTRIAQAEVRFRQKLLVAWAAAVKVGVAAAVDAAEKSPTKAQAVDKADATLESTFAIWASVVARDIETHTAKVYDLARLAAEKKVKGKYKGSLQYDTPSLTKHLPVQKAAGTEIEAAFDVYDQSAKTILSKNTQVWVGDLYSKKLSKSAREIVSEHVIVKGVGKKVAGQKLRKALTAAFGPKLAIPGGYHGTATTYFEGLAANITTQARVYGQLTSFRAYGITTYVIVNPSDERTCPVCSSMNGREFSTKSGSAQMDAELKASSVEEAKAIHPWINSASEITAITDGKTGAGASAALAKAGLSQPPFHFRCRCTIDMDVGGTVRAPSVTPKPSPKPSPKPAPTVAPAAKLPTSTPKPATPKPVIPATAKVHNPVSAPPPLPAPQAQGFKWTEKQLKQLPMKLDGAHTKYVYEAPDGTRWLFKPTREEFRAHGDKTAEAIAKATGVPHPELHVVKLKGQTGSIQQMYTDVTGNIKGVPLSQLTAQEAEQVQLEHAFDYLIGNHDGHGGNLLRRSNGKLSGIDKGQLFKFFDKGSANGHKKALDLAFNPNQPYETSFVNTNLAKYKSGAFGQGYQMPDVDKNAALQAFFKRVDALSDAEYIEMLRPYASRAAKTKNGMWRTTTEAEFYKQALERKRGLRQAFTDHYKAIEASRRQALNMPPVGVAPKPAPVAKKGEFTKIDQKWFKPIKEKDWRGNTAFVGDRQFIGNRVYVYGTEGNGTYLDARLTPEGQSIVNNFLAKSNVAKPPPIPQLTASVDPYWDDIVKVGKSVNYHLMTGSKGFDGKIPAATQAKLKELLAKLGKEKPSAIVWHYQAELTKLIDATGAVKPSLIKDGIPAGKPILLEKHTPKAKPPPKAPKPKASDGPKVRKLETFTEARKELRGGVIHQSSGANKEFAGDVYEFDLGGGIKVHHITDDSSNLLSKRGRLRMVIDKEAHLLKPSDIQVAIGKLEQLGLSSAMSTTDEMELMTLVLTTNKARVKGAAFTPDKGKTAKENVEKLKSAWEKRLGKKLTKANGYDALPLADNQKRGTGWFRFQDFRVDVDDMIKNDVGLYHNLYHGAERDIPVILSNGSKALVTTEDRYRAGIAAGGLSPGPDQRSGGANFNFLRLRKSSNASGNLRFKPQILRDSEAIMYETDYYGRQTPEYLAKHRPDPSRWKEIARVGKHNNETIVPGYLDFEDWIDEIKVSGRTGAKEGIVKELKAVGIDTLNGRKVEDAVVTSWTKLKK